jgi:hypothetical protein
MCSDELDYKNLIKYDREALIILLQKITQIHYINFQRTNIYFKIKSIHLEDKQAKAFTYKEQEILAHETSMQNLHQRA